MKQVTDKFIEENCTKCEKCYLIANHMYGCGHEPYKGKWIAEIETCPKSNLDRSVSEGSCEEVVKNHKMNMYSVMLEELYEKSSYFHDMVDTHADYDDYPYLKSIEIVIGCIMEDLEKK